MIKYPCMPSPLEFIRSVRLELKQVKWPSHETALKMTVLVIITSAAVALYSGGLDYLFTTVLQQALNR
jgi:preprotein translocase SecE subunit